MSCCSPLWATFFGTRSGNALKGFSPLVGGSCRASVPFFRVENFLAWPMCLIHLKSGQIRVTKNMTWAPNMYQNCRVFDGFWRELPFIWGKWRLVEYYNLAMIKSSPQIPEERIHTSLGRAEFDWNLMSASMVPQANMKLETNPSDMYTVYSEIPWFYWIYMHLWDRLLFNYCNSSRRLAKTIHLREFRILRSKASERDLSKL